MSANPIEVGVANAFLHGHVSGDSVTSYAQQLVDAVRNDTRFSIPDWEGAVADWVGANQDRPSRQQASLLVNENQRLLTLLAMALPGAIPGVAAPEGTAAGDAWSLQSGFSSGTRQTLAALAADTRFLEYGRFRATPDNLVPPVQIPVHSGTPTSLAIDTSAADEATIACLSESMSAMWGVLHERAVAGGTNINTLTRYVYNAFGVHRILDALNSRDAEDACVLLMTGYETPVHELLESSRVAVVQVIDLSLSGLEVVRDKYASHPNAAKLELTLMDMSGVSVPVQADALSTLNRAVRSEQSVDDAMCAYLNRFANDETMVPVALEDNSFDAVHAPFVLGSLHMGPATVAIKTRRDASKEGWLGYDDVLGEAVWLSPEAARAQCRVVRHVLGELQRITIAGGPIVANVWARPDDREDGKIRLSDTAVSESAFANAFSRAKHLFSGNPQPTLPHTVGHIFAITDAR